MSIRRSIATMTVLLLLLHRVEAAGAADDSLEAVQTRLQMSYESLELPGDERLGLLGTGLLFARNRWLSLGPGVYGAMSGDRGGFIVLGLGSEVRVPIVADLSLNSGVFVGAGGGRGGLELTGGGLLVRTHLGAQFSAGRWGDISGGVSYTASPYGSIHSVAPYVSYQYPFHIWTARDWLPRTAGRPDSAAAAGRTHEAALVYRHYAIPDGVSTDSGRPQHATMELVGVEWQYYLDEHFFLKAETEGAMGGESNGYMQILLGGGYRLRLTDTTALKLSAATGPAGGGDVATGSGLIADASLGLQQDLGKRLYVEAGGGYLKALDADFKAASFALKVGCRFDMPDIPRERVPLAELDAFDRRHLRWRITHQTYFGDDARWRENFTDRDIQLLGLQGDYFITDHAFLTGQAFAAYQGKAGAYMAGLVGAGLHLPLGDTPLFVDVEGIAGAAGGGGVNVAGGLVWQADAGLGFRINDAYSLIASYGRIEAVEGRFAAHVLNIALAHRLTFFAR